MLPPDNECTYLCKSLGRLASVFGVGTRLRVVSLVCPPLPPAQQPPLESFHYTSDVVVMNATPMGGPLDDDIILLWEGAKRIKSVVDGVFLAWA